MYVIYLPVIVAVLAPAYYFAIHYWGDYPILDNYPKEFFQILVVAWGGALLLFPLMVRALHRFRACGHSFGALHLILILHPLGVIIRCWRFLLSPCLLPYYRYFLLLSPFGM